MSRTFAVLLILLLALPAYGDQPDNTTEKLAETVRKSVVVITTPGRTIKGGGLGTGFVVGAGLIATNHHVIGEGRAINVETADGKKHAVTAVHAFDRALDLAIIKIDFQGLPVLALADSNKLRDGQPLVAVGNPHGLKYSVVTGVLSGRRELDGRSMLQLAMPVERGNSGGPVVDREGRVVGVITAKSAVTDNLGFAVASNSLKGLLSKPNSVPMTAWQTIGQLDADDWKPMLGGSWRQRAGRILVEEPGSGFGGRAYCLNLQEVPKLPYEVSVAVKLDDEKGAAGLIFHDDGAGRHYGFYPSGGGLRLTRFDGSDVYSWKILEQKASDAYRPGEWNTLRVRLEKGKLLCYVNEQLVVESDDTGLTEGRVGLAKFRDTKAEFKQFRVGTKLGATALSPDVTARVRKEIAALKATTPSPEVLRKLGRNGVSGLDVIRQQAKELEEQAARLRKLALGVHQQGVIDDMTRVLKDDKPDLLHAALLIAKLDNEELDVEAYRRDMDRVAKKIAGRLKKDADDKAKVKALNDYLFAERGFHGSRGDYYHRSNSYLNEVLDDREGLPITLSVIYMELGRRLGLKIEGVGLPGHFVVRHVPVKGEGQLIDAYDGGKMLSVADAAALVGSDFNEKHLAAVAPRAIVYRMLNNLLNLAQRDQDIDSSLRYLDALIAVQPETTGRERVLRGLGRAQQGDRKGALEDLDWVLEKMPEDLDLDAVRAVRRRIEQAR